VGLALTESPESIHAANGAEPMRALVRTALPLVVVTATEEEARAHESMLAIISKASGGRCLWRPEPVPAAVPQQTLSSA
jgi:hypothetical protein